MGIEIQQKGMAQLYGAAATLSKAEKEAQRKEDIQMQQQYQTNMKMLDAQLDLEMYERSKRWEIDKMELRSQMDFQREEQQRQRKLDSFDSALQQINKEVLAGRMTEQEAYPLKLKYEMNKMGVDVPTSLLPTDDDEEERYGVRPYWMRGKEAPEGTPERQLYEAKMAEGISGERGGTIPYYLTPKWLRETDRDVVEQVLMSREIFFDTPEELDAFIREAGATKLPLDNKQLDVGIRTEEGVAPTEGPTGQVRVMSPTGEEGTIPAEDLKDALAEGYTRISEVTPETVPPTTEDVIRQLEAGKAKFYKPSLRTFATMSPLRLLMERRKAKKIVK